MAHPQPAMQRSRNYSTTLNWLRPRLPHRAKRYSSSSQQSLDKPRQLYTRLQGRRTARVSFLANQSPNASIHVNILQQIRIILPACAPSADISMAALTSLSGQKATSAHLRTGGTPPLPVMVVAVNFQESRSDT